MSHNPTEMSVFTHRRKILNGSEFARDWNQINRLRYFYFFFFPRLVNVIGNPMDGVNVCVCEEAFGAL